MDVAAVPGPSAVARLGIERRGGLAGLRLHADCDATALTAGQRQALQNVLLAPPASPAAPGADRFSYCLRIVYADGGERTLDVPEGGMPAALAALLRPAAPSLPQAR